MKFAIPKNVANWFCINGLVISLLFTCVASATTIVEDSTPDLDNVYIYAEHPHNSPETLKNGRNPGFIEDHELPVEYQKVERKTYFDVPLDYDLQDHIFEVCEKYGVDPAVVFAVIWTESSFTTENVGDGGDSIGLMQIQPKWHQKTANELGCPDLYNPYHNVVVGTRLLAGYLSSGRGIEYALMVYNGGASYANRMMAAGEVSGYAQKVLRRTGELKTVVVERVVDHE